MKADSVAELVRMADRLKILSFTQRCSAKAGQIVRARLCVFAIFASLRETSFEAAYCTLVQVS